MMDFNFGKIVNLMKKPAFLAPAVVLIAGIAVYFIFFFPKQAPDYETVIAEKGNVIQEVSVTGKVKPATSVDLAFDSSGRVVWINAGVGDRVLNGQSLAQLFNADLVAQLNQAEASLKVQEAKLEELEKGTRQEEIQVYEVKVANAKVSLEEAKKNLINKTKDAYTKSEDAVRNKADQLFDNPRTSAPNFKYEINSQQLALEAESARFIIESILEEWNSSLSVLATGSDLLKSTKEARSNLDQIKTFLEKIALAVNLLAPNDSLSQTTIDGYKTDIYTARTNVNTAIDNLAIAEEKFKTAESSLTLAENELALKKSGSTAEQIKAQEAQVEQAKANADNYRALVAKTILRSPISGIVTKQDAKVGEIVKAQTTVISVISDKKFEIEVNVAEADIAKIAVGNTAGVTLDAYGDDVIFNSKVIKIDPAETMIEGVSTYKITLEFENEDEKIKSGMTANIDILTAEKDNVLIVPQRTVIEKEGKKIIRLAIPNNSSKTGERIEEIEVKTGLRGSDGNIEIVEGLKEGDKVIVFMK